MPSSQSACQSWQMSSAHLTVCHTWVLLMRSFVWNWRWQYWLTWVETCWSSQTSSGKQSFNSPMLNVCLLSLKSIHTSGAWMKRRGKKLSTWELEETDTSAPYGKRTWVLGRIQKQNMHDTYSPCKDQRTVEIGVQLQSFPFGLISGVLQQWCFTTTCMS